jgi:hypothetical protein
MIVVLVALARSVPFVLVLSCRGFTSVESGALCDADAMNPEVG